MNLWTGNAYYMQALYIHEVIKIHPDKLNTFPNRLFTSWASGP